ncbi:MAG: hypothetical protein QOC82_2953 [Frankiaceae bacterium]|nr:hypothetical protein [Frankiaceae bacterium]
MSPTISAMLASTGQTGMKASLRRWLRSARAGLGMCSIPTICPSRPGTNRPCPGRLRLVPRLDVVQVGKL